MNYLIIGVLNNTQLYKKRSPPIFCQISEIIYVDRAEQLADCHHRNLEESPNNTLEVCLIKKNK